MDHRHDVPLRGSTSDHARAGLRIAVMAATGSGKTTLSAFDAALWRCGIQDYNLIPLSSVIPPRSLVVRCDSHQASHAAYGCRLYVVKAEIRSAEPGTAIAAGLGWLQWSDGRGCFVEHELQEHDRSCIEIETMLSSHIMDSLSDLAHVRGIPFDSARAQTQVVSARVGAQPACALAVALYQAEGWNAVPAEERR